MLRFHFVSVGIVELDCDGVLDTFTLMGCGMAAGSGELAFSYLTKNGHDMTVITCNTGADSFEMKV